MTFEACVPGQGSSPWPYYTGPWSVIRVPGLLRGARVRIPFWQPAGTYNPSTGASSNASCAKCLAGKSNPVPGSSEEGVCKPCLPGSHAPEEGTGACILCPSGKFAESSSRFQCDECPPGALCVQGASTPQPCPAGSHADPAVLSAVGFLSNLTSHCIECPAGAACPLGSTASAACPLGTYNPSAGASRCTECPVNTITSSLGARDVSECGCKASLYANNEGICDDCPYSSTDCSYAAITVTTLPLRPAFWRASNVSEQIRPCKTSGFCLGGTTCYNASTGGAYCDGYCAPHHTGPFCEVCLEGYVMAGTAGCSVCDGSLTVSVMLVTISVTIVVALGVGFSCFPRQLAAVGRRAFGQLDTSGITADEVLLPQLGKIRILISTVQVLSKLGITFAFRLPPIFGALVSYLNVFALDFLDLLPLGCVLQYSFHGLLYVRTLAPIGIALLILILARFKLLRNPATLIFVLFFLVYPSTSSAIFSAFQFEQLDDAAHTRVLRADFNIDFDSTEHTIALVFSGVMMAVYPFGLPITFYLLFRRFRTQLAELQAVTIARADMHELVKLSSDHTLAQAEQSTRFGRRDSLAKHEKDLDDQEAKIMATLPDYMVKLVGDYRGRYFFFEIFECARKLLLVCMPVFFSPQGSVSQLIFGLMVCFVTGLVYGVMQPYKDANALALVGQISIFFALLSSVALRYDAETLDDSSNIDALLTFFGIITVTLPLIELVIDKVPWFQTLKARVVRHLQPESRSLQQNVVPNLSVVSV